MQWLKTKAGQKFYTKNENTLVNIQTDNGMWMAGYAGYTERAAWYGIYTLKDAFEHTRHCGPEKWVRYRIVPSSHFTENIEELSSALCYLATMQRKFYTKTT